MSATPALVLLVKVSLVLSAAFVAAWLARRAPARARHQLWSGAFAAVLLLPVLAAAVPALHVPVPAWREARLEPAAPAIESRAVDVAPVSAPASSVSTPAPAPPPSTVAEIERARGLSFAELLTVGWMLGAGAALAALILALVRVVRLTRGAMEVTDAEWRYAASTLAERLGLRAPVRLLTSPRVSTPMAGGLVTPTIFLPAAAPQWPADLRDVVLAHEIAHLAGRDPLRHVLTRLAVAAYWFHPLAWMAARQSAVAREQACDEAVIALGTRPSTYARVLLDFADGAAPRAAGVAALPIVQRTLLEKRLMAILNDDTRPATRRVALVFAALAALTLSVAAAQPAGIDSRDVEQPGSGAAVGSVPQVVPTGAMSGVPAGVMSGEPTGVMSGVPAGAMSGVPAGAMSGLPAGVMSGVPAGIVGGVQAGVVSGVAGGTHVGVGTGVVSGVAGGVEGGVMEQSRRDCDLGAMDNFSGTMSSSGERIDEAVGRRNYDLIVTKRFGDLLVCAVVEGVPDTGRFSPEQWASTARRVVLETREPGNTRRMEIEGTRVAWFVNGQARPVDASASEWRQRLGDLLEPLWELSRLRGEESSLRGQISSVQGHRSSLQGEISSLRGRVSSMRGEISSWQGRESSLRGEISSIQGQLSSMRGRISSEQGAISSLEARRWDASDGERDRIAKQVDAHRARVRAIEAEIRDFDADARVREVEKRLVQLAVDEKIEEVEKRLRAFDVEQKVREVEKRIAELEVEKRVGEYEREIASLEVERRARALEARIDAALKRLRDR